MKVQEARATLTNSIRRGLYDFFMRLREADIRQPDPEPDPEPNSPDDDVFWAGNVPRNRRRNRREANRQRDNMVRMVNIGKKEIFVWSNIHFLFVMFHVPLSGWIQMENSRNIAPFDYDNGPSMVVHVHSGTATTFKFFAN